MRVYCFFWLYRPISLREFLNPVFRAFGDVLHNWSATLWMYNSVYDLNTEVQKYRFIDFDFMIPYINSYIDNVRGIGYYCQFRF